MTSSLKKVTYRRNHPERSQPAARQRLGLLEKKKDYQQRAKDFNKKKKVLKSLKDKAFFKNPDEFYHAMINSRLKDGVHRALRDRTLQYSKEQIKLMKQQDMTYVKTMRDVNQKKMMRLKDQLTTASLREVQEEAGEEVQEGKHERFHEEEDASSPPPMDEQEEEEASSEQEEEGDAMDALIAAELAGIEEAEEEDEALPTEQDVQQAKWKKEYMARLKREKALREIEEELLLQRQLMTKGKRRIIGEDERGNKRFKWAKERKR